MLVAVTASQQLQELFLLSSAKKVPGCFCCLMGCWQESSLLDTAGCGAAHCWGLAVRVCPTAPAGGSWRGMGAAPALDIRHLHGDGRQPGQGVGTRLGRAVGNRSLAFFWIARDALEMLMSLGCSQTKLSPGQAVNKTIY